MSKIKLQAPVVHIPRFREYAIEGRVLERKYEELGVTTPFVRSDHWYYHSDPEGWAEILPHLVIKSSLYKPDKRDCDWYARKAYVTCCEIYELNTLLYTYGWMPLGPHGYNTFWAGDCFFVFEPNEGFRENGEWRDIWGYLDNCIVFGWGENEYQSKQVLL